MIASIYKAWQRAHSREASALPAAAGREPCWTLTRSDFLRKMAAGALTVGVAIGVEKAFAAKTGGIAPVTDLDKLYDAWQERFNAADIDALVDLYVSDVTYVNPDGKVMVGKSRVREDFEGLLALKPQIVLGDRKHLLYHDTALTTNHWKLNFANPDGSKQELTGGGIEVLRKQADGGWRYIIDDASRSAS